LSPKRALIIGPAWVGDMIMAHSLFQELKARAPNRLLDVIAPPATAPLATRMPEIDTVIPLAIPHGRFAPLQRLRLGWSLRDRAYEQAFILPRSYKSALAALAAGAKRRTAYLGEARWGLINDIRAEPSGAKLKTVERFLMLAAEPNEALPKIRPPHLVASQEQGRLVAAHLHVDSEGPILALCPGAEYGPAKRWPAAHFATLARSYRDQGWQIWLLGGPRDQEAAQAIQDLSGKACVDLTGRTDLLQALDLMVLTTAVVSNDSGLMHMAAGLRLPLVAVFGSSDPKHTPPLDERAVALTLDLSCSPCFARTCPLGHLKCLTDLSPARVAQALETTLGAP